MKTLISGITISIAGLIILLIPLIASGKIGIVSLIYGIPIFIIGLFVMFNKSEDKIEKINYSKLKKKGGR